jgi:RimJ/RimL family protein N-acetyltransferase
MSSNLIELHTQRLIVRQFSESDIPDILDYSQCNESDRFRRRNVDWEPSEEGALKYWTPMATMPLDEVTNWLALLIEVKALGRVVGNTGFSMRTVGEHRQGAIGWTLGEAFEGHGYATEAAAALLGFLFTTAGFHRVFAMSSPGNPKSWKLMERLGMRREAHFVRNCFVDGAWDDEYVYGLLAEEWLARQG